MNHQPHGYIDTALHQLRVAVCTSLTERPRHIVTVARVAAYLFLCRTLGGEAEVGVGLQRLELEVVAYRLVVVIV